MKSQIEEILKNGVKIKKSKTKSLIVLTWLLFGFGLIDYFGNKIGVPGSWIKDSMHGLFLLIFGLLCFTLYNSIRQAKFNLEIIERIQELEQKLSK